MKITSLYLLILMSLLNIVSCSNYTATRPRGYEYKAFEGLPSARAKEYKARFVDSSGKPIRGKIHLKQTRQNFMLNNREGFTNYIWLESIDMKIRGFNEKRNLTKEHIIKGFGLEKLARERNLEYYLDLRIPISFMSEGVVPDETNIEEYEAVETHALRQYYEAFNSMGVNPDYVHILAEFNQKMNLNLHFDTNKSIDFADRYIRTARGMFPKSKLVVDLGPLYCFEDFNYPMGPDGGCIRELKNDNFPDHLDFLKMLEEKGSPFDVIGIEYQMGSHHSSKFEHFREFFDRLSAFGKPIFIWEFWVLSGDLPEPELEPNYGMYTFNRPEGGWTEEYQRVAFEDVLSYINDNPQIVGLTQFGWKDCMKNCGSNTIGPYGIIREDGTKKPSYYVMQKWYRSWFTECDLVTDPDGKISFLALPGRYIFSKGLFNKKTVDIKDDRKEIELVFDG